MFIQIITGKVPDAATFERAGDAWNRDVRPTVEGTTIYWLEDARFRFAGPIGDWVNRVSGRKIFGRLVDGLLDDRRA